MMTPANTGRFFGLALLGLLVATGVTTTMDATGLSAFSALPLLPIGALFWALGRHSRQEMAFSWGRPGTYLVALLHPLLVLGVVTSIAYLAGVVDTSAADWGRFRLGILAGGLVVCRSLCSPRRASSAAGSGAPCGAPARARGGR